ncbi:CBN-EGO-1 protein [Caenorhabditis brenneri]|uniref:RNA-directed RNA polymerase n=1 Tax=Caenorhabditis brenneri TaxID=135651 RepID=G0P884_CAEBE|nr:CBN-EGO-1 protein [Caenorhabditis brenneri]
MGDDGYRGWIKLEVPCSFPERQMNNIIRCHTSKLEPALNHMNMRIQTKGQVQVAEEQDCEPFYEANYEVVSDRFSHHLIVAIQNYLKDLAADHLMPFQRGNLVLHSSDFWSTELTCHLVDIPLAAFFFGNIQGGTFINHWEVSFWEDTLRRNRDRVKNIAPTVSDKIGMNQIKVEFEFDKVDFMTVHFKHKEADFEVMDKDQRKTRQTVTMYYQITVRRTSIRRVIVDPVVHDVNGTDRVRVHFELNCPVLIRRAFRTEKQEAEFRHVVPHYKRNLIINRGRTANQYPTAKAITDSPVFTIEFDSSVCMVEIYRLLSRLRVRTGVSIEFADIPSVDCLIWRENPYHRWTFSNGQHLSPTHFSAPIYRDFITTAFPRRHEVCGSREIDTNRERKFAITYLLECLISRGAVVKDQILLDEIIWHRFLEVILHYYTKDDKLCEAGLEDLVHMIDGRKRIGSLIKCFDRICQTRQKNSLVNGLTTEEMREGYQRVRKIIFTPTRVIYVAPETLMGNRVLRRYDHDGTRVLRITFRDDDNQKMRTNKTSTLLEKTVNNYLHSGITVAGRNFGYLGSSNSQMRDNGAYFMEKYSSSQCREYEAIHHVKPPITYNPKIQAARKNLGRFETIDNIPKMMARLGQCFTQSRLSGVNLDRCTYMTMYDLTGGKNIKRDEYTFSDGVGMMSLRFAQMVSQVMDFGKGVPSCFQFRFRGMKGVIAVEPLLDMIRKWSLEFALEKPSDDVAWGLNCVFRPSQIKFISKRHPRDQVEIVKYSSPVPVSLNKPFINILDQVSEMQSLECHRRVTNRIEELLDRQMLLFAQQMVDETFCRNRLKELPRRVDIDYLRTTWGFTLSSEPFFRSLIKASIKFSITKQLRKEQIPIPQDLGRSMLGVVDETGRLQYGQIFVQYTKNLALKLPPKNAARQVLTGTVLLTKNPCIVAGDVRIFEAVDIPELHHMCDVVVFPQHGPRPHPDEMAGSDLDGDEYSIIWDQQLLLDKNEDPFDFTSEKQKSSFKEEEIDDLMREFYVKYLKLDSVGTISNSHLHNSDQYGLNARVCMDLAKKNCQAVDFTKSGQPPDELERKWRKDEETGEMIPPERCERVPDYHMGNDHTPMYVSPRLCGKLFREFKAIDDVLKISEERDEQVEISIDENIMMDGYESYMHSARDELSRYNAQLRSMMENYGIKTEGEVFSGCIVDMRNRISDKDQDDMSFYNTNQMIETKVTNLFKKYREHFFEEFEGGWEANTESSSRIGSDANILQRQCRAPTQKMMRKAVAWYRACYEEARITRENKKLSFAWIAFDVIAMVKQTRSLASDDVQMGGANPLFTMLDDHRSQYLIDNEEAFETFSRFKTSKSAGEQVRRANGIIQMYVEMNPGLDEVLYILNEWATKSKLFDSQPLRNYHFSLLFLLFATRQISSVDGNAGAFFNKIDENNFKLSKESGAMVPNHELTNKQKSHMTVKFLEFLASRKFRKMANLSFRTLDFTSIFLRGEWQIFHVAALKTYYNVLFNLRFEELPVSTDPTMTIRSTIRENEPFVIELPAKCDQQLVHRKLMEHTGVEEIFMRCMEKSVRAENEPQKANVRLLVSTRGTLEAMYKLRQLVAVKVPIKTYVTGQEISSQMARLCYEKIIKGHINN